jgi:plasmid stabilization system protein ParE
MKVRYTPRSRRDLEAIYAYIDEQSPGAARAVKRAIQHAVEILAAASTMPIRRRSFHTSGL